MKKQDTQLRILIRSSAIYDVMVTTGFAIPLLRKIIINSFQDIHTGFHLSGSFGEFGPMQLLFVSLLGSIVTVWSVIRIVSPRFEYALYDSAARFLFSFHMAITLFALGGSQVIWLFLVPEVLWGIGQIGAFMNRPGFTGDKSL